MSWDQEFPPDFHVPRRFAKLVAGGVIEDMSWRNDPCPSFGVKLKDKNWARLWVEHPNADLRRGWPRRFTIIIQGDPTVTFGRRILATDDPQTAYDKMVALAESRGARARQGRFKIASEEKAS